MNEIRSLTALRGVAALWVFAFHVWLLDHGQPEPSYADTPAAAVFEHGWTGVDLFFVLSGYILATVHPTLSVAGAPRFLVRRAFRLYPLHVATTLALAAGVALASAAGIELSRDGRYGWDGLPASLLLVGAFLSEPNRWNSVTWSISVELVCYALLPVALPALRRVPWRGLAIAAAGLAAAAGVWIVALDGPSHGLPAVVRGLLGFYLGCCVALASAGPDGEAGARFGRHAGAWALAAAVVLAAGIATDLPCLVPPCAAILVGALAAGRGVLVRVLTAGPLVWLGRVSFSIYLLHMPVLSVLERLLPPHRLPLPPLGGAVLRDAVALAVVLATSALAYRLLEEPGRRLPSRLGLLAPAPRLEERPEPPHSMPRRRFVRSAVLAWVALLHVLVGVLVAASDLLPRAGKRWGLLPQDDMEDRFVELTLPVVEQARRDRTVADGALIVLGDSIAKQIDSSRLGGDAVNHGIGGDTVRMLIWRLPVLRSVENARAVVVNAGVNDLKYRPVAAIAADYRALLTRIPHPAAVVVISPLPVDEKAPWPRRSPHLRNAVIRSLNAVLRPACEERPNCRFVDAWPVFAGGAAGGLRPSLHSGDGLHLSPAGSRALEALVRDAVHAGSGAGGHQGQRGGSRSGCSGPEAL